MAEGPRFQTRPPRGEATIASTAETIWASRSWIAPFLLLTAAYCAASVVGVQWAAVGGVGSPVWPAAGIGLAGLMLGGVRLWPAIVIGRLLAGVVTGSEQTLAVEVGVALGNGAATALPVLLLRAGPGKWTRGMAGDAGTELARIAQSGLHAALSAGIGTTVLVTLAGLPPERALPVGTGWFFGAFVGAVTVTPLLMSWAQRATWRREAGNWVHLAAILAATAGLAGLIFATDAGLVLRTWSVFPVLVWAALAFGVPGAAAALVIASTAAIGGATAGVGPFTELATGTAGRVALAQQFSALMSITILLLAAVAEERRGKQAAERSEARLRDVLESTTDSVFVLDRDFRLTYLNANAVRMIAQGRDLAGQVIWDAFPEAVGGAFFKAYTEAMETGRPTTADEYFAPLDLWFEANAYPSAEGLTVFFRDVTEQRRAAFALARDEARIRAAQAVGGVLSWEWNLEDDTVTIYGPVEELLGHDPDAPFTPASLYDVVHPDDRGALDAAIRAAIEDGEPYEAEFRVQPPGGRLRWLVGAGEVIVDEGGTRRMIGINYDVTGQREATEALARLNADLETRVAEGAAQLHQLQKLESLGQLTGGVAHDFNNLLAAVLSSLSALRRHLPEDDARAARLLDNAEAGARRGATLTQRMLAFARRQDLEPEPVDLSALVAGMEDLLDRSLGPRIAVRTRFADGLPAVLADPAQLELALLNLAVNARDAMPDGGDLTLEAERTGEDFVALSVTDTGTGMDAETIARATEPFFTTKGVGKGTGLGLPMVQGLAEQSGGRFVIRSRPGEGTTATIVLPLAKEATSPPREKTRPPEPAPGPAGPLRVLAVDDDALVLMGTVDMLEDLGHHVWSAGSGEAALGLLSGEAREADVLVTDQAMPGMTGIELARRAREARPDLPVVLATGYADLPEGAADHVDVRLGKPFADAQLGAALARAVAARTVPADA